MERRRFFNWLKRLWSKIYKQLTQFSLRFRSEERLFDTNYQLTEETKPSTKLPLYLQQDLLPKPPKTSYNLVVVSNREKDYVNHPLSPDFFTTSTEAPKLVRKPSPHSETKALTPSQTRVAPRKASIDKGPLRLAVDKIPLIDIAVRYGWTTGPVRHGSNAMPCPLPSHTHSNKPKSGRKQGGSFTITTQTNIARCWSCGERSFYDGPSLLAAVRGETKQQTATLILARDFGIISEEVFQRASAGKGYVKPSEIQKSTMFNEFVPLAIPEEELNYVNIDRIYRCLMLTYKLTALPKDQACGFLSKADFDYLHKSRGMSEESIRGGQFFTFPHPCQFKTFVDILLHNNIISSLEDLDGCLKGVPGFYYDTSKESWTFKRKNGVAIPIKNADGLITAIQIRNSDREMKRLREKNPDEEPTRYEWFSSKFDVTEGRMYGTSCGSPLDVVKPKILKSSTVFVTEGHFKAQAIAETFHCIAISVQGVTTFKGIQHEIKRLIEQGYSITKIYLAYDADLSYKAGVFKSSQSTMNLLADHFPNIELYYVGWNVNLGKGIDDLIQAGHKSRLSKLPRDTFESLCHKLHENLSQSTEEWDDDALIAYYNQNILTHFPGYETV